MMIQSVILEDVNGSHTQTPKSMGVSIWSVQSKCHSKPGVFVDGREMETRPSYYTVRGSKQYSCCDGPITPEPVSLFGNTRSRPHQQVKDMPGENYTFDDNQSNPILQVLKLAGILIIGRAILIF